MSDAVGNLEDVDDETAALLQFQLEDLDEFMGNVREEGESPEGDVSDIELTLRLEIEELKRNPTLLSDRQMTKSIARAVFADAPVLSATSGDMDEAAEVPLPKTAVTTRPDKRG